MGLSGTMQRGSLICGWRQAAPPRIVVGEEALPKVYPGSMFLYVLCAFRAKFLTQLVAHDSHVQSDCSASIWGVVLRNRWVESSLPLPCPL